MKSPKFLLSFCLLLASLSLTAQSPVNGFMQPKRHGSVVISYNAESYDEVFLVPTKVQGVPVFNDVKINSASLYATYGLSDKLNLVFNLPYIQAKGNASEQVLKNLNYENTRKGIQDVSAYLKYQPVNLAIGDCNLNVIGAVGIKTPLGNYKVDEGLQSIVTIGNRATSLNTIAIAMLKTQMGLFTTGQVGYSFRSGQVPNAFMSELKVGYAGSVFYADAFVANQTSTSGLDILGEGFQGFFPATKVNYTRLGLNLFVPVASGIGLSGGSSTYIDGRNLGKSTSYYGGIIFSF